MVSLEAGDIVYSVFLYPLADSGQKTNLINIKRSGQSVEVLTIVEWNK